MGEAAVNEIIKAVADCFASGHRVIRIDVDSPDDPKAIILRLGDGQELRHKIHVKNKAEFFAWYRQAATWWRVQWAGLNRPE